jgi:Resolvase, N terminal domain
MHPGPFAATATPAPTSAEKFVAYFCAGSDRGVGFGLDLEEQRKAVFEYLDSQGCQLVASFTEVTRGRYGRRPELERALVICRSERVTLVVATFGPIIRNFRFLMAVVGSGVACAAADRPHVAKLTSDFGAVFAEYWR